MVSQNEALPPDASKMQQRRKNIVLLICCGFWKFSLGDAPRVYLLRRSLEFKKTTDNWSQ